MSPEGKSAGVFVGNFSLVFHDNWRKKKNPSLTEFCLHVIPGMTEWHLGTGVEV